MGGLDFEPSDSSRERIRRTGAKARRAEPKSAASSDRIKNSEAIFSNGIIAESDRASGLPCIDNTRFETNSPFRRRSIHQIEDLQIFCRNLSPGFRRHPLL